MCGGSPCVTPLRLALQLLLGLAQAALVCCLPPTDRLLPAAVGGYLLSTDTGQSVTGTGTAAATAGHSCQLPAQSVTTSISYNFSVTAVNNIYKLQRKDKFTVTITITVTVTMIITITVIITDTVPVTMGRSVSRPLASQWRAAGGGGG